MDSPIILVGTDGFRVSILSRGATVQAIEVPHRTGPVNVCLGYADVAAYRHDPYFMGSTVGRYAGRIDRGRLPFECGWLPLAVGGIGAPHCLHGGPGGFHVQDWSIVDEVAHQHVTLRLDSPAGDQGFPGEVTAIVRYELLGGWQLAIDYRAQCSSATVINLANHAYFNLDGGRSSVLDHVVRLHATSYTPLLATMIPRGDVRRVEGTAFDLRQATVLGERLAAFPSLHNGFDHNFVVDGVAGELRPAAEVISTRTGLRLTVHTTQPGLQFYTGGSLGHPFQRFGGLCLEAQNFPDAPHHAGFPDPWLRPGQIYRQRTVYAFDS